MSTVFLSGRKAIAAALGFTVKEGRGRMPREVKEAVDAAIADGRYAVEEKSPTRIKVSTPTGPTSSPVKPRKPREPKADDTFPNPRPQVWPDDVKVFEVDSGKRRGNREVCMSCACSLQWCECHLRPVPLSPKIVSSEGRGYVAVRLEV